MTEPSVAELVRRVEALVTSVENLTNRIEATYATKESVEGLRMVVEQRLKELEKDNDARANTQRQIVAGLVIGFVMLLIPLISAIQNIVGRGTP